MQRKWFGLLPALALVLALVGCEPAGGPVESATPSQSATASGDRAAALAKVKGVVPDSEPALVASQVIGSEGGTLRRAGHVLTVPAGAVSEPTSFTLRLVKNGYVEVELRATVQRDGGKTTDVGEKGFARPVMLQLNYALATEPVDPSRLLLVWVKSDGTLVALPSTVDVSGKKVSAELEHFSRYAIAGN